jgi:hypothetical protein
MRIGPEHDSQRTRCRPVDSFKEHADRRTEKQDSQVPEQDFIKSITRRILYLLLRSNSRSEHKSFSADHEVYQSDSGSAKSVNEFGFA